jgi:hypothetical protein
MKQREIRASIGQRLRWLMHEYAACDLSARRRRRHVFLIYRCSADVIMGDGTPDW